MYNRDRAPTTERTKRWVSGAAGDYTSQNRSQASCKAVVAVRFDEELMCLRKVLSGVSCLEPEASTPFPTSGVDLS